MIEHKICKKCNINKPITCFPKASARCKMCAAEYARHYRQTPSGKLAVKKQNNSQRHKLASQKWHKENIHRYREHNAEIRETVFNKYGGFVCAKCGIADPDVLTLDHIYNEGGKHRRSLAVTSRGGAMLTYRWAIKNNFPPIFQVLCHNCNWKKHIENLRSKYAHKTNTSI